MRLLSVRGEGLASLVEPFVIDFVSPPLSGAGLFLIAGPTGSGKSTVLDAVSLALFDNFPRLAGAGADTQIPGPGSGGVESASSPAAILTRGSGQGYAEVDFVGMDGRSYRSRWEVHRARGRADGRLQDAQMSLTRRNLNGTDEQLGGTRTETLAEIVRVLGLTFEQFARTVLLAQNHFDAFLTAAERERSELLEKMTGEGIYAAISRRVFELAKEKQDVLRDAESAADAVVVLGEDVRAALLDERDGLVAAVQQRDVDESRLRAALRWWDEDMRLAASASEAIEHSTRADAALATIGPLKVEVLRGRAAWALAPRLNILTQLGEDLRRSRIDREASEGMLSSAQAVFRLRTVEASAAQSLEAEAAARFKLYGPQWSEAERLDTALQEATREAAAATALAVDSAASLDRANEALAAASEKLADLQTVLSAAEQGIVQRGSARALSDRVAEANSRFSARAAAVADRVSLEEHLHRADATHTAAEADLAALEEQVKAAQQDIDAIAPDLRAAKLLVEATDTAALRHGASAIPGLQTVIRELHSIADGWRRASGDMQRAMAERREQADRGAVATANAQRFSVEAISISHRLEEARHAASVASSAATDDAERLRARLVEGQPCPVCGSKTHPLHGGDVAATVALLTQRVAELHSELDVLQHRSMAATLEADAARAAEAKAEEAAANGGAGCEAHCSRWSIILSDAAQTWGRADLPVPALPPTPHDDAAATLLESADSGLRALASHIATSLEAWERHRQRAEALQRRRDDTSERRDAARVAADAAMRSSNDCRAAKIQISSRLAAASMSVAEQDRALLPLLAPLGVTQDQLEDDPVGIASTALEAARVLSTALAARDGASAAVAQLAPTLARLEADSTAARRAADIATDAAARRRTSRDSLSQQRASLFDGEPTHVHRTRHNESRQATATAARCTEEERATAGRMVAAAETALTEKAASEMRLAERLSADSDGIETALSASGLSQPEARALISRGKEWLAASETTVRDAEDAVTAHHQARTVAERAHRTHRDGHEPTLGARGAVEVALAALAAERETSSQRLGAIETMIGSDDAQRVRQHELLAARDVARSACDTWDAVNEAIGSRDGAKFRVFALRYTFEALLSLANEQLRVLAPRYRLERGPEGDLMLQVVDHDMAGEIRSPRSLSGGERFLVALALALALSTLGAGRTAIETLFIDEGFGSLDPESLDRAMAGLEALQTQGRTVGIITHVEAMKERVCTQILVEPLGGGRSRIVVHAT